MSGGGLEPAAFDIVIPTIGRPSLAALLESLERAAGPRAGRIFVVDDRAAQEPLTLPPLDTLGSTITVLRSSARGPAAARNAGWRASNAAWVAFLDDDVVVSPAWYAELAADLRACGARCGASQGRVSVPLPAGRRPTDWERNVAGLEQSQWITADCAYRRTALAADGGFDERFPRAFREDADLALRVTARGWTIERGRRTVVHAVRQADWWTSVRLQAGNADDALMRALHGPAWYERAGASRGRFARHAATVAAAGGALACTALWFAATAEFAWRRIAPGPRTPREIAAMAVTSAAIPFAAVWHRVRGELRARRLLAPRRLPKAVLFDRDGTLVVDVPYNRDPDAVRAMPRAREALDRLRATGLRLAVVTNQRGLADGRLTSAEFAAVNARIESLVGPLGPWFVCPHAPADGCACRKPKAGLILDAARALGVDPRDCIVIGDIGADIDAAHAAGARAILVPTAVTLAPEIARAQCVARSLDEAVELVLAGDA